jgi:hypothetical protein
MLLLLVILSIPVFYTYSASPTNSFPPSLPLDPLSDHFPITLLFLSRGQALASLLLLLLRLSFILLPFPHRRIMPQALCHSPSQCDVIHVKGLEGPCFFSLLLPEQNELPFILNHMLHCLTHTMNNLLVRVYWDYLWPCQLRRIYIHIYIIIYIYCDDINQ